MIETKLQWHYFKDKRPEEDKPFIQLNDGGSVSFLTWHLDDLMRDEYCEEYKNNVWAYLEVPKVKEFHVWLDTLKIPSREKEVYISYEGTKLALEHKESIIHTTQTSFLKTSILDDYRLFVHKDGKQIEITLGECQGTDRIIKAGYNLEKLVLAGEFSFND